MPVRGGAVSTVPRAAGSRILPVDRSRHVSSASALGATIFSCGVGTRSWIVAKGLDRAWSRPSAKSVRLQKRKTWSSRCRYLIDN